MNYKEAREYINSIQKSGIKLGLTRMKELMHELGDVQNKIKTLHIAGTNGKGSTANYKVTALASNGYKIGCYTSPAVEDVREQYTVNREWINEDDYANAVSKVKEAVDRLKTVSMDSDFEEPTAFEQETAVAFVYFYDLGCDYIVIECGMGGREDATNVVDNTCLSILTSISEDHIGMIGNNISEIAYTKAGIIKKNSKVLLMDNIPEVVKVVKAECDIKHSELTVLHRNEIDNSIAINAIGEYQKDNANLALRAIQLLNITLDNEKCCEAVCDMYMPYRMERLIDNPLFYVDGAHNPDAANRLRNTLLSEFDGYSIIYIIGMFKDKDYRDVISKTAELSKYIFTVETPNSTRALPSDVLADEIRVLTDGNIIVENAITVDNAVNKSIKLAKELKNNDEKVCIIAFGSLSYLKFVKEKIKIIKK